ncbi:MAG: hypothetical protein JWO46_2057 [Nocardioidaceae bacterium]|nr:hypothetical protein [Nocardioidaceae bacterium]
MTTERDEDALWRSIVENYGDRVTLDPPPAERASPPSDEVVPERITEVAPGPEDDRLDARLDSSHDPWDDDPEDHYVPPEPPPLPRPEPPRLLAWAGVFGVPVLTIVLAVFHVLVPTWASLMGLAWFVGGFGYLVATMRRDHDDYGGDDGAVI